MKGKVATITRFVTDNDEWSGITGVLVTYEKVLYVSTVSVTPHYNVKKSLTKEFQKSLHVS